MGGVGIIHLLKETRAAIFYNLLEKDSTAIELSKKLNINESAIRQHLDILEREGLVSHYFARTSVGRPKKMYRITPLGKNLLPRKTDILISLIARKITGTYGKQTLKSIIVGISEDLAEYFLPQIAHRAPKDIKQCLEEMTKLFNEFGFFASISKRDGEYIITYRNCVFGDVLSELGGQLCEMHRCAVTKILGTENVMLEKCIARGDNFCNHRILIDVKRRDRK